MEKHLFSSEDSMISFRCFTKCFEHELCCQGLGDSLELLRTQRRILQDSSTDGSSSGRTMTQSTLTRAHTQLLVSQLWVTVMALASKDGVIL